MAKFDTELRVGAETVPHSLLLKEREPLLKSHHFQFHIDQMIIIEDF